MSRQDENVLRVVLAGPIGVVHADEVEQRGFGGPGRSHDGEREFLNLHVVTRMTYWVCVGRMFQRYVARSCVFGEMVYFAGHNASFLFKTISYGGVRFRDCVRGSDHSTPKLGGKLMAHKY